MVDSSGGAGDRDLWPDRRATPHASPGVEQLTDRDLSLLADATHLLVSSPDMRAGLQAVSRLLIPEYADWVVVDIADPDSNRFERASLAHRDPTLETLGQARLGVLPPPTTDTGSALGRVLLGGPAEHTRGFPVPDATSDAFGHDQLELFQTLGSKSAITAPLHTRTRALGALTLVRSTTSLPYGSQDVVLASELAGRIGLVVENAWLFERLQRRAEEMQRALLPTLPGRINGIELAGVYRPADDLSQVGGDWYDAFGLQDGTIALVIGDVAGHDLHAATRMGAIRHKLRAIAADRMAAPSEILSRLDAVLQTFTPDDLATVIYGRLAKAADGWTFEWSSAGHPPPLLLEAAGTIRLLDEPPDVPVGVLPAARNDRMIHLRAGSGLLLYTDGLVERNGEPFSRGLKRLIDVTSRVERSDIQTTCEALVKLMEVEGIDDVAVLGIAIPVPIPVST